MKQKQRRKTYVRPEAESVWMDNEALMDVVTGSGHDQSWDAKQNAYFDNFQEEELEEENEWGTTENTIW